MLSLERHFQGIKLRIQNFLFDNNHSFIFDRTIKIQCNFATFFFRAKGDLLQLDLSDFDAAKRLIEEKRPTYLVHSAAQRFPDQVNVIH